MKNRFFPLTGLLTAVSLSACAGLSDRLSSRTVSAKGLNSSLEDMQVQDIAARQDALLEQLEHMSQLAPKITLQPRDANWELVMKAGLGFVGSQCNQYLTALFHFDRDNRGIRAGLIATGTAATTIMGLAGAAANPIAATAAVFGLGETYFDANVNAVVFQVGPAAVRNIVVKSQDVYRDAVMDHIELYQSRPDVIIGLQGYLQLCTPVAIESAVEAGASSIDFDLKTGPRQTDSQIPIEQTSIQKPGKVPPSPPVQIVVHTIASGPPPKSSASLARVKGWLFPNGKVDHARVEQLISWMSNQTVDSNLKKTPMDPLALLGDAELGSTSQQIEIDRQQAILDNKIP